MHLVAGVARSRHNTTQSRIAPFPNRVGGFSFACKPAIRPIMKRKPSQAVRLYLIEIGKAGGAKHSVKKAKTSAENGKLGGRPRKKR